jgi:hypothetical protein
MATSVVTFRPFVKQFIIFPEPHQGPAVLEKTAGRCRSEPVKFVYVTHRYIISTYSTQTPTSIFFVLQQLVPSPVTKRSSSSVHLNNGNELTYLIAISCNFVLSANSSIFLPCSHLYTSASYSYQWFIKNPRDGQEKRRPPESG